MELQNLAAYEPGRGRSLDRRLQLPQPVRFQFHIVVHDDDPLACAGADPLVHRFAESLIRRQADDQAALGFGPGRGAFGGGVVDHDHLNRPARWSLLLSN